MHVTADQLKQAVELAGKLAPYLNLLILPFLGKLKRWAESVAERVCSRFPGPEDVEAMIRSQLAPIVVQLEQIPKLIDRVNHIDECFDSVRDAVTAVGINVERLPLRVASHAAANTKMKETALLGRIEDIAQKVGA